MLINSGLAKDTDDALKQLKKSITTGAAYEKFIQMASALGANKSILDNINKNLPKAKYIEPIYSKDEGYVSAIDTRKVGLGVIMLGGGRTTPEQKINYTTGFTSFCQIGDKVDKKTPLCYIHAEDKDKIPEVKAVLLDAIRITAHKPQKHPTIIQKIA